MPKREVIEALLPVVDCCDNTGRKGLAKQPRGSGIGVGGWEWGCGEKRTHLRTSEPICAFITGFSCTTILNRSNIDLASNIISTSMSSC